MRRTILILSAALLMPSLAGAQSLGGAAMNTSDPFSVSVSPQYPSPHSTVTLSFLSSSLDLSNARMAVYVAGKQTYQGTVQPVAVPVGKTGSVTSVKVTITTGGIPYSHTLTLQPEDVVLVAEPVASAPPLYPGKPLVPLEGNTRIVAVASFADAAGKTIDPATLSYTWTVEDAYIANSSGIGKSSILVASPLQYRTRTVSVLVQSQMGSLLGKDTLSLEPVDPSVRLYENDPLFGIRFDHALSDSYTIPDAEASLYAAPFSLPLTNGSPFIQWFLNGSAAQTGPIITLRPSGSGEGTASLSFSAGTGTTLATAALSLIFGSPKSSNFFGL